jgi:uncharacterized peroxidase-related enzyme
VDHHGGSLREITGDAALADQIIKDFRKADLDGRTMRMLEFSEKVTKNPGGMSQADVEPLRKEGMSDEEILDLVQLIAYFNYTNRVATALGVDPEH